MPCKSYKNALIHAAATNAELQAELRAHLAACASCRIAYAEERSLFASIDAGLRKNANAEVPASLLPRVRDRLDEAAVAQRRWMRPLTFAAASVALAAIVFLVARPHHARTEDQAKQIPSVPAHEVQAAGSRPENSGSGAQMVSANMNHSQSKKHSTQLHSVASSQPEVLVPPDERQAFARFVAEVQERSEVAAALLTPAPKKNDALVSVEPLQIADVELKPLEGSETEVSDREAEKH